MAEFVTTLLQILIPQVKYLFLIGKITKNFESEMEKLISARDLVLKKVEVINIKKEKVNDAVWEWIDEVKTIMEEEEKMQTEIEADSNNCFLQGCSIEKKYHLYNEMKTKMEALNTKCDFEPFSIPIPGIEYFSSGNFVCFKSTKEASDQLLEALQDDNNYIIGLYGMRGSGKTKLVKALSEKARFLKIFDPVIFVNVSQNPSVKKIQDEIAEWLNLKLDTEKSETVRARRICLALHGKERFLVILDDVREKLELEDIGIPCGKQWKVLLTTRVQVVCNLMDCHMEIPLHPLSEDESWMWFKKHAGINDESSSDLLNVAREICVECKGIPQTIKEVASSLIRKPIGEWEASLDSLRYSTARYQIFLSFRGMDTRHTFTGFLYHALCQEGLKTFMDDEGLESGDQISNTLIDTIKASRLSIVVFSENYAYSTWCLDELVTILECMKTKKQMVWPIFYKVYPSDVRHQKNSYGQAMDVHKKRFGDDSEKVQKWKSTLSEIANLSGEHYQTGYEYEFIQKIVKKVENVKHRLCIQHTED